MLRSAFFHVLSDACLISMTRTIQMQENPFGPTNKIVDSDRYLCLALSFLTGQYVFTA